MKIKHAVWPTPPSPVSTARWDQNSWDKFAAQYRPHDYHGGDYDQEAWEEYKKQKDKEEVDRFYENHSPHGFHNDHDPWENPKKVTYLAIMPRHRKPKAVPKGSVGFYQARAKKFFEAPDMTAAQAREAIKRGELQPTWVDGQPVSSYEVSSKGVRPKTKKKVMLGDLMDQGENAPMAVLRIGRKIYTPHPSYSRHSTRPYAWHEHDISGFTYSQSPMSGADFDRHMKNKDTFELAILREDFKGIPMGAIVAIAQSGMELRYINSDSIKRQAAGLSGRKFSATDIIEGGQLTAADEASLMR